MAKIHLTSTIVFTQSLGVLSGTSQILRAPTFQIVPFKYTITKKVPKDLLDQVFELFADDLSAPLPAKHLKAAASPSPDIAQVDAMRAKQFETLNF
ncbi:MAG: hypothetical protein HY741_00330 [Chloroflexi bacterium]|nr:hypothetical protein [Chloroflexota bacterium]